MELVNGVFEIAEEFMKNSSYVFMNKEKIKKLSVGLKQISPKKVIKNPNPTNKDILIELVASSINYCYWHGKSTIRPNGSSSSYLYELIRNSFYDYNLKTNNSFTNSINTLIQTLSIKRFPLLEERVSHLKQLQENAKGEFFVDFISLKQHHMEYYLNELVTTFPGFASDIFLKRASLFFIQLYRNFGWFEEELNNFHVPSDYQIPRVLNKFGCIYYTMDLQLKIENDILIPKHSIIECEIRAATILTIKQICDDTNWNVSEVDSYLFWQRNTVDKPFHLCITTDY